jgi:5S rRNA maturation endonuclease (ribonuclease M5)
MENPRNLDIDLIWRFADIEAGGWVQKDELYEKLDNDERILIVTEGSSDSDISDFFYFVDMEENYPFTGTGNLFKFCQGLSSIKIQNKVIVLYDNDTAGEAKYKLSSNLTLPDNMKVIKLPDHDDFKFFTAVGPNGRSVDNINGSAVSIEFFLDLSYKTRVTPCVRWTSYDEKNDRYQGELINKEMYVRIFKDVRTNKKGYNFSKLKYLIDYIYDAWTNRA